MIEQNKISYQPPKENKIPRRNSQKSEYTNQKSSLFSEQGKQKITKQLYQKILNQQRPPIRAMLQMIQKYQQKKQIKGSKETNPNNNQKSRNGRKNKKQISKLLRLAKVKQQEIFESQMKNHQKAEQLQSKLQLMQTLEQINYANSNSFFPKPIYKNLFKSPNNSKMQYSDNFLNQQSRTISLTSSINYQNPQAYLRQNGKTIDVNYSKQKPTMQKILQSQSKVQAYLTAASHLNHLKKHKHVGKKYLYKTIDTNKYQIQNQQVRKSNKKLSSYFLERQNNHSNIQSQKSLKKSIDNSHAQTNSYVNKILSSTKVKELLKNQQNLLLKSIQKQKSPTQNNKKMNKIDYKSKGRIFYNNLNTLQKSSIIDLNKKKSGQKGKTQQTFLFPQIRSYGKFKDLKGKPLK